MYETFSVVLVMAYSEAYPAVKAPLASGGIFFVVQGILSVKAGVVAFFQLY